jgi:hypothetical protein
MIAYEAEDLNSHKRVCVCNNWDRLFSKIDSTTNKDWPPQLCNQEASGTTRKSSMLMKSCSACHTNIHIVYTIPYVTQKWMTHKN